MNILIIGLRKKDIDRLKNKFKNLNLSFILSENITSKSFNNIEKFKNECDRQYNDALKQFEREKKKQKISNKLN